MICFSHRGYIHLYLVVIFHFWIVWKWNIFIFFYSVLLWKITSLYSYNLSQLRKHTILFLITPDNDSVIKAYGNCCIIWSEELVLPCLWKCSTTVAIFTCIFVNIFSSTVLVCSKKRCSVFVFVFFSFVLLCFFLTHASCVVSFGYLTRT